MLEWCSPMLEISMSFYLQKKSIKKELCNAVKVMMEQLILKSVLKTLKDKNSSVQLYPCNLVHTSSVCLWGCYGTQCQKPE